MSPTEIALLATHAPRIEALEGLLAAAQQEAAAGREAITSLASERAANELLTNEVERLRADVAAERERMRDLCSIDIALATLKASELAQAAERERWAKLCDSYQPRSRRHDD